MDVTALVIALLLTATVAVVLSLIIRRRQGAAAASPQQSMRTLQSTLHRDPKNRDAARALADTYYRQHKWRSAHQAYSSLYGETPQTAVSTPQEFDDRVQYAISAYMDRDIDHAHRLLSALKDWEQKSFEYYRYYGLCNYERREFPNALSNFQSARQLNDTDIEVHKYIALTNYYLNNIPAARTRLEILGADNEDPEVPYTLAHIYFKEGQMNKALNIFSNLAKTDSYSVVALLMMARIYKEQNEQARALQHYTRASRIIDSIGVKPEIGTLYSIGMLLNELEEPAMAIKYFIEIEQRKPGYRDTRELIEQLSRAIKSYTMQQYLRSDPAQLNTMIHKIIPPLLKSTPSLPKSQITNVTYLTTPDQSCHDYSVRVGGEDRRRAVRMLCRFLTSKGTTGEIPLREFCEKIDSERFNRGVFVTAGQFSGQAQTFAMNQVVTLCDGKKLQALLQRNAT